MRPQLFPNHGRTTPTATAESRSNRSGTSLVEFAVMLPVILLLLFGMIEFGRAAMVLGVLANAARSGAREAAVTSGDYSSVATAVQSALASGLVVGTPTIEVQVNGLAVTDDSSFRARATPGTRITVIVGIPYDRVSWVPWSGWFLHGITLREGACMRREA